MINKQLAIGFAAGLASSFLLYQWWGTQQKKQSLSNVQKKDQQRYQQFQSEEYLNLKNEQLARVIKYFGEQKYRKLQNSFVLIFGVGGVGSHVANMIARSGVKRIKIVDFDRVSLSSLNRHSFAVREDVGISKVSCIQKYVNKILPHVKIETVQSYVTVENAKTFLEETPDYVIDCIDNLDAKVEIITICKAKNIKLIVSGGAGMKCDPTKLQIRDISDSKYDSLTARLKRQLGKKGIKNGVKTVFSYQQADKELLPLNQVQEKEPENFKVFDNYRIRIVPVLGTMPAIIGMAIASYVLCQLADEPFKPFQTDYVKATTVSKVYTELLNDQKKRKVGLKDLQIDMEEIAILSKKVYKWKCLISDKKESSNRITRWDASKPPTIDNLVYLGKEQYEKHMLFKNIEEANYSEEILTRFKQKSQYAKSLYDGGYMMFI